MLRGSYIQTGLTASRGNSLGPFQEERNLISQAERALLPTLQWGLAVHARRRVGSAPQGRRNLLRISQTVLASPKQRSTPLHAARPLTLLALGRGVW